MVQRVLIVDDEGVARTRLRKLLSVHSDLEIVGEAGDGAEALEKIEELSPDLVFLDVQMPVCDGLEAVASLGSPAPQIIFCTAYDQYAVDAFELNAIDYLLKPVSRSRLAQALQKLRTHPSQGDERAMRSRLVRVSGGPPSRFLGRRGNRFQVVQREAVVYFESEGGLTRLHSKRVSLWMQPSLNEVEERLEGGEFFRISRSSLVNLPHVREVAPVAGGYGQVVLSNGTRLDVSRRKYRRLLELLDN